MSPTALAISPPTLASISSNTMSGVASWSARELLTASITREISPLEAIWRRGLSGSPGFGPNWKSMDSRPCEVGLELGMIERSKAACLKPSSLRWVAMTLASFGADFWRVEVSFFPAVRTFVWRLSTSSWRSSRTPSRFSISSSLFLASFPCVMTASSVEPYFLLRVSKVLMRSESLCSSSGSVSRSSV